MDPLPGSLLSDLLPLCHRPLRLLPFLLVTGRRRNFEGSSLPSQPQIGGILGRHWHIWQSFSADEWTITVLRDGYRVSSHHLPLVSLEPRELPSCSLGSVRALALREEVSKMLQKGALEPADQPGLGFYSWLFLMAHHRSVGSQWLRQVDEVPDGDSSVCVEVYQIGGLDVLDGPQKHVLPDSCPSGISAIFLVLSRGTRLPVPYLVFQSVHGPTGVHQSPCSGFGVAASEGHEPPLLCG